MRARSGPEQKFHPCFTPRWSQMFRRYYFPVNAIQLRRRIWPTMLLVTYLEPNIF
jgi:hypothetical protein